MSIVRVGDTMMIIYIYLLGFIRTTAAVDFLQPIEKVSGKERRVFLLYCVIKAVELLLSVLW